LLTPATTVGVAGAVGALTSVTDVEASDGAEVPFVFVAVTVNVYGVFAVSPTTVIVPDPDWDTVPVLAPVFEVAVYVVIAEPPLDAGAVNATVADVDPVAATAPMVGAPGTVTGVTGADAPDAPEVPPAFVAVTLTVYGVPFVSPVTSQDPDAPVTVHAVPATTSAAVCAVTVKEAGALPAPAATVTVTLASPATTVGLAGVPGADTTVTTVEPSENRDVLMFPVLEFFFTAATLNEYVPSASPVAVHVRAVDLFVALVAHPVPAPVHGPPVPDATFTS
jgi:hypothetical protein